MTRAPEPGLVVKLRPTGPWRIGPDSGERHDVDSVYHSDSLYSAITGAMSILGFLEDWLSATARNPVFQKSKYRHGDRKSTRLNSSH